MELQVTQVHLLILYNIMHVLVKYELMYVCKNICMYIYILKNRIRLNKLI